MNEIRIRTIAVALACGLTAGLAAPSAHAETEASNVELVAMMGGRIIGAAKACSINAERVRRTSERLLGIVNAKASSNAEKQSARAYFEQAQSAGAEQVRSERSRCSEVHVDFSEIEVRLGRASAAEDRVVAKRGVPPLGALKPEVTVTR